MGSGIVSTEGATKQENAKEALPMAWTEDPLADFNRHDAQQQAGLRKLPKCKYCKQRIQEDTYFEFDDKILCENCLIEHHRKWVDDYVLFGG